MADGSVVFYTKLDNSELDKSISESKKSLDKYAKNGENTIGGFLSNIKTSTVAAFAAIGVAINGFFKSLNRLGRIDDLSQQLGMSRGEFQQWEFVAEQSGVAVESLGLSMRTLSDAAISGSKAFKALGVDVKDSNGQFKSQTELFKETIQALQNMPAGVERTSAAVDLLGRSGMSLATIYNLSNAELDDMLKKAPIISDDAVKAGDRFGDTITELKRNLTTLADNAIVPLITAWQPLIDGLIESSTEGGLLYETIKQLTEALGTLGEAIGPLVGSVGGALLKVLRDVAYVFNSIVTGVKDAGRALDRFFGGLKTASDAEIATESLSQLKKEIVDIDAEIKKQGERSWISRLFGDQTEELTAKKAVIQARIEDIQSAEAAAKRKAEINAKALDERKKQIEKEKEIEKQATEAAKEAKRKAEEEENQRLEIIKQAWVDFGLAVGNSIQSMAEMIASGTASLGDVMGGFANAMTDIISAMGDALIQTGIAKKITESFANVSPETMIAAGFGMKLLAGTLKGILSKSKAKKYATGGIVEGSSYVGDNVPAYVNSGEMILNKTQQRALWDMANGSGNAKTGVNIQIINNTDSQVTAGQDDQGNIKVLIEKVVLDTLGNNKGAAVLKNNYNIKRAGV